MDLLVKDFKRSRSIKIFHVVSQNTLESWEQIEILPHSNEIRMLKYAYEMFICTPMKYTSLLLNIEARKKYPVTVILQF